MTEEGKYSLDAVQNNPDIEGTLASEIKKMKASPSIAMKTIELRNVSVTTRSAAGAYYGGISSLFADNGIEVDKVISATIEDWSDATSVFNLYVARPDKLGFISPVSQTIGMVKIKAAFLG